MDSGGKLEAVIMKKLTESMNIRFNAGYLNSDINYAQVSLDLNIDGYFLSLGNDYTHSLKLGNQVNSMSMMQSIGKRTVLGFELMHLVLYIFKELKKYVFI